MINKISKKKISEVTRKKMSLSQLGRKHSNETKKKISLAHKGKRKGVLASEETKKKMSLVRKGRTFRPQLSEYAKKRISIANSGKIPSKETRKKISIANKGKKRSLKTRKLMSQNNKGNKSSFWKGGICDKNKKIRSSMNYKLWRKSVFERDNFTCQKYGISGRELEAHHINNFADFPELRFAIDNGITLSKKVHIEFHVKYGRKNNTKEQLLEFLNK